MTRVFVLGICLASVGCAPMLELKAPRRERYLPLAENYCAAVRSGDSERAAQLLAEPLAEAYRSAVRAGRAVPLTSAPMTVCTPGKVWYLGGSRVFVEVRLQGGADRLDIWAGDFPKISDVQFGRPVATGSGVKARTLTAAAAQPK
ncbi:MAG TPA: hypothetical protein VD929_09940 [Caulobacteraceae bacterium]|nr:hypothetical protein [Caulobacteraceae bacterium]